LRSAAVGVNDLDSAQCAAQIKHAAQRGHTETVLIRSLRQRRISRSRDLLRMAPLPKRPRQR
jgi:hypothetical protein